MPFFRLAGQCCKREVCLAKVFPVQTSGSKISFNFWPGAWIKTDKHTNFHAWVDEEALSSLQEQITHSCCPNWLRANREKAHWTHYQRSERKREERGGWEWRAEEQLGRQKTALHFYMNQAYSRQILFFLEIKMLDQKQLCLIAPSRSRKSFVWYDLSYAADGALYERRFAAFLRVSRIEGRDRHSHLPSPR